MARTQKPPPPVRGRGFQRGVANPRCARLAHAARLAAAKKARATQRKAALAQPCEAAAALGLLGAALRSPLSSREPARVVRLAKAEPQLSQAVLAAAVGVSQASVSRVLRKDAAVAAGEETAAPATGGRPRAVGDEAHAAVRAAFAADPLGGINMVRSALWREGYELSESTLRREMERCVAEEKPIKRRPTSRYAVFTKQLISMHLGWQDGLAAGLERGDFDWDDLYFMDQTPLVWGVAAHSCWSATPVFLEEEHKHRGKGKLNLHCVCSREGWVKVVALSENTDDDVVVDFMTKAHKSPSGLPHLGGKPVFKLLPKGSILLADRLGRSGRAQYPIAMHYNPKIKAAANEAGIGYCLLPPKGAEHNPIELANGQLQKLVLSYQLVGEPVDAWGHIIRGPRTKAECLEMINRGIEEMNKKPELWRYFYYRRATGSDAYKRFVDNSMAQEVRAARAADAGPGFDLAATAFAKTLTNIHANGPPKSKAARAGRARWEAAHKAAGLPVPSAGGAASMLASDDDASDSDKEN